MKRLHTKITYKQNKEFLKLKSRILNSLHSATYINHKKLSDATNAICGTTSENVDFLFKVGHEDTYEIYNSIMYECKNALNYLKGNKYDESNLWYAFSRCSSLYGCVK